MRAVVISAGAVCWDERPEPVPGRDELLVRVEAAGINRADLLQRAGRYPPPPGVPTDQPGMECAGVVEEVGSRVRAFAPGDRVMGLLGGAAQAELALLHERLTLAVPSALPMAEAGAFPEVFCTAHDALFEFGQLAEGETALIHAGAGGVGLAAIQMAKRAGARVIATASSDERLSRLGEYGLDDGINYREKDFVAEVRSLTHNRGADVILDSVGGENLQRSLTALAYRGRCVTFGNAGRDDAMKLDTSMLGGSNQSLIGYFLGPELFVGSRAHEMIAKLLDDVAAGDLRVAIDRRFALADAEEAHEYIESRQAFGRVVLLTQ